ncbi:MAG: lactate utilization protein [Clostridia bacterium]|jgi:hypothetical protein|nr:lactate utilization protein [Clostridia bacterium]
MDFSAIKQNLENHGFIVSCFQSAIDATKYLDGVIDGKTIGIGGSKTVEQMGLLQALETHNRVLYRFGTYKSPEEVMKEALTSDVFITSANGVAETGEIVNIDGNCNRIAAEFYGHERVYIIVGSNKIQPTFEQALWRARNVAAPKNAKRFGKNTPCVVNGDRCYDCSSPERICRGLAVMWRKPSNSAKYEVVLIDEELGF